MACSHLGIRLFGEHTAIAISIGLFVRTIEVSYREVVECLSMIGRKPVLTYVEAIERHIRIFIYELWHILSSQGAEARKGIVGLSLAIIYHSGSVKGL